MLSTFQKKMSICIASRCISTWLSNSFSNSFLGVLETHGHRQSVVEVVVAVAVTVVVRIVVGVVVVVLMTVVGVWLSRMTFSKLDYIRTEIGFQNKEIPMYSMIVLEMQYVLGWGSGSRNTENTGKYRSSIVLNTENVQYQSFNTIEYWKCSIPNFQYYRIPKEFQYRSSILPKFSVLLPKYRKCLITTFSEKKCKKIKKFPKKILILFSIFGNSSVLLRYSSVFSVIIPKIQYWAKKIGNFFLKFFWNFFCYFFLQKM